MAGGAGALPAASVFDLDSEVNGDVQNGLRLTVFVVGNLPGFELDRLVEISERYLGHSFILAASAILVVHVSRFGKADRRCNRLANPIVVRDRDAGADRAAQAIFVRRNRLAGCVSIGAGA